MLRKGISIILFLSLLPACTTEPAKSPPRPQQPIVKTEVQKVYPPKPLLQRCGPTPKPKKPANGWEAANIYLDWKDYALKCRALHNKLVDWYE